MDPVAVSDKKGMFNNIILFTVLEDITQKSSAREMHIFEVVGKKVWSSRIITHLILLLLHSFPATRAITVLTIKIRPVIEYRSTAIL